MFEDSTFESTGSIHTRSTGWMLATFTLNGSMLLALILIPLLHPAALPRQALAYLLSAPAPLPPPTPPPTQQAAPIRTEMPENPFQAPRTIPRTILVSLTPEPVLSSSIPGLNELGSAPNLGEAFRGSSSRPTVHPESRGPVRVPSSIVSGLLVRKILPVYPPIARNARVEGTVILQASISKAGIIENLRVAGGPAMLQQAALDAVKQWVYRPYLLNGEPVDVETTVNVVFTLGR
jgi:protein TonB